LYGPGLAISDFNLGILYMLAVSSLATYGILLAGFFFPLASSLHTKNTQYEHPKSTTQGVFPSLRMKYVSGLGYLSSISKLIFIALQIPVNYNTYPSQKRFFKISRCFIHTNQDKNNSNNSNNKDESIQDLFKDRIAPVIPFDRDLIKGSCLNYTDKLSKAKFLPPPAVMRGGKE
jgi:hypothetical protein